MLTRSERAAGLAVALFASSMALASAQQVVVEPNQRLIPAGRGQPPFDVTRHLIPLSEIDSGSVPRNAIPALFRPHFIKADLAEGSLKDSDRVLGVFLNGEAKAYPIRILNWHELVNDDVGGVPALVSWCPLCGSGIVYDPVIDGRRHAFGVSGLLYKRNLLMFDTQTDSLWSQLLSQAVTGPYAGKRLRILPAENTTWGEWRQRHPRSWVMSFVTGHVRDYGKDPYAKYPIARQSALLVRVGATTKVFPYSELAKARRAVKVDIAGSSFEVLFDRKSNSARVQTDIGRPVVSHVGFLDNLTAFFPAAEIYRHQVEAESPVHGLN